MSDVIKIKNFLKNICIQSIIEILLYAHNLSECSNK